MLRVALELLAAGGLASLSVSAVCKGAGISRATFYRRWKSPIHALTDAIRDHFQVWKPVPGGSIEDNLTTLTINLFHAFAHPLAQPAIALMAAERASHSTAADRIAGDFRKRRAALSDHVAARLGQERGEAALDVDVILNTLNGFAYFTAVTDGKVIPEQARALVTKLLG